MMSVEGIGPSLTAGLKRGGGRTPVALIGMALAGGFGERVRPLSLKASGRSRARAEARFMGRPAIRIQLAGLRASGIGDVIVVSKSRESRFAIRSLVGHGNDWDLVIRYTPPRHDHLDRGTADAVIRAAEHFRLMDDLLVFPVDTLLSTDLMAAWAMHRREEALLTLVTVTVMGRELPAQGEVVRCRRDGAVAEVIPAESGALTERFGPSWPDMKLPLVTGFYFVNAGRLRRMALDPSLARMRQRRLDFDLELVNWAAARGEVVAAWQAPWSADLSDSRAFLNAARDVLAGRSTLTGIPLGPDRQPPQRLFSPDAEARRPASWHNVYLGYDTIVGRNCRLEDTYIGDECVIGHHVTLVGVHLDDGAVIGDGAVLVDSLVGQKAEVGSRPDRPTHIQDLSAVGDGAVVSAGAHLTEVLVLPGARVPGDVAVLGPAVLRPETGPDTLRIRQLPSARA